MNCCCLLVRGMGCGGGGAHPKKIEMLFLPIAFQAKIQQQQQQQWRTIDTPTIAVNPR